MVERQVPRRESPERPSLGRWGPGTRASAQTQARVTRAFPCCGLAVEPSSALRRGRAAGPRAGRWAPRTSRHPGLPSPVVTFLFQFSSNTFLFSFCEHFFSRTQFTAYAIYGGGPFTCMTSHCPVKTLEDWSYSYLSLTLAPSTLKTSDNTEKDSCVDVERQSCRSPSLVILAALFPIISPSFQKRTLDGPLLFLCWKTSFGVTVSVSWSLA